MKYSKIITNLSYIIISTSIISLIAFVGILTLSLKDKLLNKILLCFINLSADALMSGAFIHLIPESIQKYEYGNILIFVLVGFILFLL